MQKILTLHSPDSQAASSGIGIAERLNRLFPGTRVLGAGSGEEGFAAAQREQPDIIVLDDLVPEAEGNALYKQLKASESTKHIPVIMLREKEIEPGYSADILLARTIGDTELETQVKLLLRLKEAEEQLRCQEALRDDAVMVAGELRQSEEKYRQAIDNCNDAIYLLYNRKFEFINKKFQEMFQVTLKEVNHPGFDFIQLVAPKSKAFIEERGRKLERGEYTEPKYEFTALARDGRELEVEASVSRLKYKDGIAIQGVVRDMTRRKQLERRVRQAQRIEAISTLAGGIAHQFNNILAIIRGYTELSLDGLPGESLLKRNLLHILTASDRARDLVNQILIFSQQAKEGQKPLDLSSLIRDSLRLLQSSLPGHIELRQEIHGHAGIVMADPTQIRQLIVNLCTNAADAVGNQKGVIEVSLNPVALGPENMGGLKNLEPGPYLELTVTDSGPGMEQKVKERIFDPFFTTKATGEGMGMGLAVIHGIVKTCGGDIQVESEPDEGTAFHLFFPCLELEETETPKEKAQLPITEPIPCGNERLLFVDDENMLVDVHREILERLGYDVVTAANGFEALEVFSADPARVDLAIVDYAMPGMTGVELSRKLLKIRAELPIILCTGLTKTTICQEAMAVGIKEFIMKPIIMKDLAAVIRDVLEKKNKEE